MNIEEAAALVQSTLRHSAVLACYKQGDANSSNQTKHDISHADEVLQLALRLIDLTEEISPGKLDEWTKRVVVPMGAFLHDIGRCINVENHDSEGAKWAMEFLQNTLKTADGETLPIDIIRRIARVIACHRTNKYVKVTFEDPALDIVLIADKCVGDEARVRWFRKRLIRLLSWFRLGHLADNMRVGGIHDRANFAIKEALVERVETMLVLNLTLDTDVCLVQELYELYGDRFHCCVLAARKLGFGFSLRFNGVLYAEVKENEWKAV